eukprot:TRINITY_DN5728_c0_g1_i2.p1 TRINITY_DN5728_c0_g1~~TRINITY_DN5728_c0_g1_i2.p1  ORF type:complete len:152 (-),score=18.75 TRINITY_DN5728_c0_g1_i2:240-695(-)
MTDPSLLRDVMSNILATSKINNLDYEAVNLFLNKCTLLIEGKYPTHVKAGLEGALAIIRAYREEVIQAKAIAVMSKVDLAREERMKKYDRFVDEFKKILNVHRVRSLAVKRTDELGELAKNLIADVEFMMKRCKIDVGSAPSQTQLLRIRV